MSLQNGVSRRSTFLARLCTAGAMCAVMAVADELVTILAPLPSRLMGIEMGSMSLMENLYFSAAGGLAGGRVSAASLFRRLRLFYAAGCGGFGLSDHHPLLPAEQAGENSGGSRCSGAGLLRLPALELLDQFISNRGGDKGCVRFFCRSVSNLPLASRRIRLSPVWFCLRP